MAARHAAKKMRRNRDASDIGNDNNNDTEDFIRLLGTSAGWAAAMRKAGVTTRFITSSVNFRHGKGRDTADMYISEGCLRKQ